MNLVCRCIPSMSSTAKELTKTFIIIFSAYNIFFNPIKTEGLNLCKAWGVSHAPTPYKKVLENRYRVVKGVHRPIFQGQFIEEKK